MMQRMVPDSVALHPGYLAKTRIMYYLVVSAFSKDGQFLGTTKSGFTQMWFSIPGYKIIGENITHRGCKKDKGKL
jgi:hypothetical protein